jgi:hypothetical protein
MVYVLFAAVAAGAAIGGARSLAGTPAPTPAAEPAQLAAVAAETPAQAPDGDESANIQGEVLEAIDVPNYSYLRVGAKGTEGNWVAVPTAPLKVGDRVKLAGAMKMTGFTSTALKRSFPVIYFGTLDDKPLHAQGGVDPSKRNPHANGADPHATGAADPHANGADPHAAPADPQDQMKAAHGQAQGGAVEVKPVERAKGPEGRTVAEVIGQRTKLAGKTVRIHGTVVKANAGILGKTYLHLRDGSGDAAAGTNDITVTTTATPAVGDVVTVEGAVVLDRDIGSGYKFPTLVDDAKVLSQ